MKADENSFPESRLRWTIGGSARVPRAGSGVAPEPLVEPFSLGDGFPARRRKRQPGRSRSPLQNRIADVAASRQSAADCAGISNGGFLPKAATLEGGRGAPANGTDWSRTPHSALATDAFPEIILGWTTGRLDRSWRIERKINVDKVKRGV